MAGRRKSAKKLLGAGVLAALTVTAPLYAVTPNVALGEVSSRVERADVDLGALLRAAVKEQLDTLPSSRGGKGPVVLSAALVRMETEAGRVTCEVSATLRTARGGTMIAIVEGRAGVETQAPVTLGEVRQAVIAAAHAAIFRVPEALR